MIDSHCHLDYEPLLSDLTNVIIRSKKVGDVVNLLIIRDKLFKNVNVTLKKLETDPSTLYDKSGKVDPPNNK